MLCLKLHGHGHSILASCPALSSAVNEGHMGLQEPISTCKWTSVCMLVRWLTSSAVSTVVKDPCICLPSLESGLPPAREELCAAHPGLRRSLHAVRRQEECYYSSCGQPLTLPGREQGRGWGLPVCRSGLTSGSPARGAPPLTISLTLPPSRSRILLNTSQSNSGVACVQTPSFHTLICTITPHCRLSA